MPNKCHYCGEYTLCRKNIDYFSGAHSSPLKDIEGIGFDYICKKCSDAFHIKYKKDKAALDKIRQEKWRKERNKILANN